MTSIASRILVLFLAASLCGGCAQRPFDAGSSLEGQSYRSPDHRADHAPWGSVFVRRVEDRRPSYELGRENYLNDSWFSEVAFVRTVPATLKILIERELTAAGVMTTAADAESAKYLVDIVLDHFTAKADRDVLGLIPVIPSIEIEGVIELGLRLTDQDGRPFLDKRYLYRDDTLAATVSGVQSTASELLYTLLTRLLADVVPECDQAIPQFWSELGMEVQ